MKNNLITDNRLPLPTPSEAAFERLLVAFESEPEQQNQQEESVDAFVDRLFLHGLEMAQRDPFAGIGERDAFPTKIVGVSFEKRQDVVAGLTPGMELDLVRQADNPADGNAIAVFFGNLPLGFLRRQIARHLAPRIDGGLRYRARIEQVTGGGGKHFGVNIRVEREVRRASRALTPTARERVERLALRRALIGEHEPHDAQEAVLARVESGKNTLAVLGTGRGKSFCFQYPAAYRALEAGAKTLVVYPLRALVNDQYDALSRRLGPFGLRIFRANGSISAEERAELMDGLETGSWDIILATPEFLQYHLEAFTASSAPSFVVVDEAHHLFESKHRPAYGRIGQTLASMGTAQILALTATARDDAFAHVVRELRIERWIIDPTVRENLRVVDARGTKDKLSYLGRTFDGGDKGIVYCNSRTEASKTAEGLRKRLGNAVAFYHAGMPAADRARVEELFRAGDLRAIVATSAFGEGIDLPDVRHVVLYHLNFDFTEFNQQAGRAGRDGAPAQIHLLFGESDRRINDFIIDRGAPTIHVLRALYKGLRGLAAGGVVRMAFTDIARTLELDKADERTVSAAVRMFEDEGLLETGIDDDGRYMRFLPTSAKIDLTQNERFAEGEAERENFGRFCDLVLNARATDLERIINRPIYPERVELQG